MGVIPIVYAATANINANSTMLNQLVYNVYTIPEGEQLIGLDGKLNPHATLGRAYEAKTIETVKKVIDYFCKDCL